MPVSFVLLITGLSQCTSNHPYAQTNLALTTPSHTETEVYSKKSEFCEIGPPGSALDLEPGRVNAQA